MDNLYQLLNIDINSTIDDIKKAYRKLSLDLHPDRNNNNKIKTEMFNKITNAYEILSDSFKKNQYDNQLNNPFNNPLNNQLNNPDFFNANVSVHAFEINPEIIMSMFLNPMNNINTNNINTHNNKPINNNNIFDQLRNLANDDIFANTSDSNNKADTIYKSIEITLYQAFKGYDTCINFDKYYYVNNKKKIINETIDLTIPKGIDDNEIIIIEKKGNYINENNIGDIEIKITINPHELYYRHGLDLLIVKNISFKESLCGFSFNLKYIDDREFKIVNEPGNVIPDKFEKVIKNMGIERNNEKGNLIIKFNVEYPNILTKHQIKELDKIL